ncbi:MAG TPA: hypothetical protein VKX39_03460 [Bryobacteraceae bacterium]|nr:hypothetical protein [Bryobacteraceae bacterium]
MGLAISTGHPIGMVAATGMPFACLTPGTKRAASKAAVGYYLAALWPMVIGLERYVGRSTPFLTPVAIWVLGGVVLSIPWVLAATADRLQYVWRAPLALAATVIPPLGIIGLASPLTAAGFLYPGTGWIGLATVALMPGIILGAHALPIRQRRIAWCVVIPLCVGLATGPRVLGSRNTEPPRGWVAVNTHFGDVSQPFQDFVAAQFIQDTAAKIPARVVIFPESVVPRWSEATEAFWLQSLGRCRAHGQILAFGAGLPRPGQDNIATLRDLGRYDFAAAIDALKSRDIPVHSALGTPTPEPIDNALVLAGAESATYYQRLPVPIGMWQPLSRTSVPLRLSAPGVLEIDRQRAAVLICYEQMLTFPMLSSMLRELSGRLRTSAWQVRFVCCCGAFSARIRRADPCGIPGRSRSDRTTGEAPSLVS